MRIGLHTGEVIEENGDIHGETVIIARRLEGIAPPGGILASESVHMVLGTARGDLDDRGLFDLKGIAAPWRVYAVPCLELEPAGLPQTAITPYVGRVAERAAARRSRRAGRRRRGRAGPHRRRGRRRQDTTGVRGARRGPPPGDERPHRRMPRHGGAAAVPTAHRSAGTGDTADQPGADARDPRGERAGGGDADAVAAPAVPRHRPDARSSAGAGTPVRAARHAGVPPAGRRRSGRRSCCTRTSTGRTSRRCCCWSTSSASWRTCASSSSGRIAPTDLSPERPFARSLAQLTRLRAVTEIRLRPLDRDEVAELFEHRVGRSATAGAHRPRSTPSPTATRCSPRRRSATCWRPASCSTTPVGGATRSAVDETEVPRTLAMIVGRRLDVLQPATRRVLAAAAVIGRVFTVRPARDGQRHRGRRAVRRAGGRRTPPHHRRRLACGGARSTLRPRAVPPGACCRTSRCPAGSDCTSLAADALGATVAARSAGTDHRDRQPSRARRFGLAAGAHRGGARRIRHGPRSPRWRSRTHSDCSSGPPRTSSTRIPRRGRRRWRCRPPHCAAAVRSPKRSTPSTSALGARAVDRPDTSRDPPAAELSLLLDLFRAEETLDDLRVARRAASARRRPDRRSSTRCSRWGGPNYIMSLDRQEFGPPARATYEEALRLAEELADRRAMVNALTPTVWFVRLLAGLRTDRPGERSSRRRAGT